MLPSLGFQEIVLLAVLALVVVGPKDLPLMLRKLGRWTAKLRAMAQEFRHGFDELARQAELDELKKEVDALRRNQTLSDLQNETTKPVTLPGALPRPPAPETASFPRPHRAAALDAPAADTGAPDAPADSETEGPPAENAVEDAPRPAVGSGAP
jgi:sec-independent protein translocase protein TatB